MPVICFAPLCWLLWRRGGERIFWDLLLGALQSHGPIAIKLAQWISTRPDIFSPSVCREFAKLQANVRPHSYDETARILSEAFGTNWPEALRFESEPIGSGCMAQVYRGRLRCPSGLGEERPVAVKVRHPGADVQVDLDLEVLHGLVRTLEWCWRSAHYLALSEAVDHFEDFVRPQANLAIEASNLESFARNFDYGRTGRGLRVRFPEVMRPYVTEAVLVESFEEGLPLQVVLQSHPQSQDGSGSLGGFSVSSVRERVGGLCLDAFLQMIFADNFIHGDMHPGNILFRLPSATSSRSASLANAELVLLDAGLAVHMKPRDRRNFLEVFDALARNDGGRAGQLMVERSPGEQRHVRDAEGFVVQVRELVGIVGSSGIALGKVGLGDLFGRLLGLACHHRVKLETSFVQVATSIVVLEGVGRQLTPVVNLAAAARPLLAEAVAQRRW